MKNISIIFCASMALGLGCFQSPAATEAGFKPLCNGHDLTGWDGNPKLWSVNGHTITGQTSNSDPIKGNTFLIWTNGTVGDFELRCSFRIQPKDNKNFANSGIQYRSKVLDPKNWVVGGYQADMEAGDTYTGILYEERMTRGIMAARGEKVVWDKDCKKQVTGSLGKSEDLEAAIKKGDWNDYVVIARGNHLQHFINGKQTVDVTDDCEEKRAMDGVLALQLHAGGAMMVEFRDLRLKEVGTKRADAGGDSKKLQGDWQVAKFEANGSPVAENEIAGWLVTISGNSYTLIRGDSTDRGTFTLDSSRKPARMDIHPKSGSNAGETMLAIYEVGDDTWKMCYAPDGGERPQSFSTDNNSGCMRIEYKRKQPSQ